MRKLAGFMTLLALLAIFASPVAANQGNPPQVECASDLWSGRYFKQQINDGNLAETEGDGLIDLEADGTWTNLDTQTVFRIVLKVGQGVGNDQILSVNAGTGTGGSLDLTLNGLSHVTFCFTQTSGSTTSTSTTLPTTTTTEASTTTTDPETTTSSSPTSIPTTSSSTTVATTVTTVTTSTSTSVTTPTDSSTTTVPGSTSTVGGGSLPSSSTTATPSEGSSTTTAPTASTLPYTGNDSGSIALIGLVSLILGALSVYAAKVSPV